MTAIERVLNAMARDIKARPWLIADATGIPVAQVAAIQRHCFSRGWLRLVDHQWSFPPPRPEPVWHDDQVECLPRPAPPIWGDELVLWPDVIEPLFDDYWAEEEDQPWLDVWRN